MASASKCLLLVLLVAALSHHVEPRSRPANITTVFSEDRTASRVAPIRRGLAQRLRSSRPCLTIHSLLNGEASCDDSGCRLTCHAGYVFGNTAERASTLTLRCDAATGTLLVEGRKWTAGTTLCTPAMCSTPCSNGGRCVGPDTCSCTGAYTGDTCEKEVMLGDQPYKNYYPGPLADNQRRVECEAGTRMPDGSTSVTLTYRDNSWFFPDGSMMIGAHQVECHKDNASDAASTPLSTQGPEESPRFQRLASPQTQYMPRSPCASPCLNKGVCEPNGTCTCRPGYAGHQCEQRICRYPRFQNEIHALPLGTLQKLTFQCLPGRRSSRGDRAVTAVCVEGHWRLEEGGVLTEDAVRCA